MAPGLVDARVHLFLDSARERAPVARLRRAPESAKLMVATAKAHGRRTFVHCSGEEGLAIAARAGVGSIEHGFFMNRETLAIMRDNHVAWIPTSCPVHFQWAKPEAAYWSPNTVGNRRRPRRVWLEGGAQ